MCQLQSRKYQASGFLSSGENLGIVGVRRIPQGTLIQSQTPTVDQDVEGTHTSYIVTVPTLDNRI